MADHGITGLSIISGIEYPNSYARIIGFANYGPEITRKERATLYVGVWVNEESYDDGCPCLKQLSGIDVIDSTLGNFFTDFMSMTAMKPVNRTYETQGYEFLKEHTVRFGGFASI